MFKNNRLQQKLAMKAMHAQDFLKLLVSSIHQIFFPTEELSQRILSTNPDLVYNKIIMSLKTYTQSITKEDSIESNKILEEHLSRILNAIETINEKIQLELTTTTHKLKISKNFSILALNLIRVLRHSCDKWSSQVYSIASLLTDDNIFNMLTAAYTACDLLLKDTIEKPADTNTIFYEISIERAHLAFFKILLNIKYRPLEETSYTSLILNHTSIKTDFIDFKKSCDFISKPDEKLEFQQKYFISLCHYHINVGDFKMAKVYLLQARNLSDILVAKNIPVPIITLKASAALIRLLKNGNTVKEALFYSEILIEQISDNINLLSHSPRLSLYTEFLVVAKEENDLLKKYLITHYATKLNELLHKKYEFQLVIHVTEDSLETRQQYRLRVNLTSPDEISYLKQQLQIRHIGFSIAESDNALTLDNILTEHFPSIENAFKKFATRPVVTTPITAIETTSEPELAPESEPELEPIPKHPEKNIAPIKTYQLYTNFKHTLFVQLHPNLILHLNKHHPKELQNLIAMCEVGRLLQNSKGKKGFIILEGNKIKAKDCSRDMRFFGGSTKDKNGNLIFTLDSLRYKHDKGKLLTFK